MKSAHLNQYSLQRPFFIKPEEIDGMQEDRYRGVMMLSSYHFKEDKIMAYVISDECVSCGTCEAECPSGAISQGDDHYVIDAAVCVDCGTCAEACPTGAISPAE